uniref:Uncharacterized protein n=1 Tax=viral metagenome TaxID=1070528 RepID=A0A6M3LDY5_9ZZZZ
MKRNVVFIDNSGVIQGVEEYDPRNDAGRPQRRQLAAEEIAKRLGITSPQLGNRGMQTADGEWGIMSGDFQVGMVEIGIGKWGF